MTQAATKQALPRASRVLKAGTWDSSREAGSVTLAFADRHRRRIVLAMDQGGKVLLDLERAAMLRDGDGLEIDGNGLELEDGSVLRVIAAPEPCIDLTCDACDGPDALLRLAWHIGNRHAPVMVVDGRTLRIQADPVLLDMARGQGAEAVQVHAPFQPEGGAYEVEYRPHAYQEGGHVH